MVLRRLIPVLLVLSACALPQPTSVQTGPFYDTEPVITDVTCECDVLEAEWAFVVSTDGWTGGGTLWIAENLDTIEKHSITSTLAAEDGTWDNLKLDLAVENDWRNASSGSSTRWRCADTESLTMVVWVYASGTGDEADCLTWGMDTDLWADTSTVTPCDEVVEMEPWDTEDTGS